MERDEEKIKFKILDESYTLGNLLQEFLLKDDRVEGAGFEKPHPLRREIVFNVFVREGDPLNVVRDSVNEVRDYVEDLGDQIRQSLGAE